MNETADSSERADRSYRALALFVRNDGPVGGLPADRHFEWLYPDQLWVRDSSRGTGVGSALLRASEDEERRRAYSSPAVAYTYWASACE